MTSSLTVFYRLGRISFINLNYCLLWKHASDWLELSISAVLPARAYSWHSQSMGAKSDGSFRKEVNNLPSPPLPFPPTLIDVHVHFLMQENLNFCIQTTMMQIKSANWLSLISALVIRLLESIISILASLCRWAGCFFYWVGSPEDKFSGNKALND